MPAHSTETRPCRLSAGISGESHGASCERPPASLEESYRRCFVGGDLSAQYKSVRPVMPPAMVADIVEYANQTVSCKDGVCADVGCGPGQSTERFCPHFRKVVGIDISETQIGIARAACTAKNVSFEVANAESLPLDAGSVALVSTVNALHWFHWDSFFAEVRRVLVDGGVFCPSMYRLRAVAEPGLEDCFEKFRHQEFKGYLTAQHDFWTYGYETTEVPFRDVHKKDFAVKEKTRLSDVMACVRTWSFVIRMEEKEPERAKQALERLETRIRSKLGKPDEDDPDVQVAYRASYILCRK
ncbi:putative methyltransferase DDB_G0268948 [Dermacentor andersoni]|uniref:putative methyltransferase DDB_G0268948 n=1 Tax=Dermacentor andersoni TaxID=34620 RepID=UPI003B3B74F9